MLFRRILQFAAFAVQLLLAVFFLFVGGMKSLAPMPMLQLHHAWVADLPAPIARCVGVSELVCAATMILGLFLRPLAWWSGIAAWTLVANQAVAVAFHIWRGEIAVSGPQNVVLILALVFIGLHRCVPQKHDVAAQQDRNRARN